MTHARLILGILAIIPVSAWLVATPLQTRVAAGTSGAAGGPDGDVATGIAWIWARDPVAHGMCFADGLESGVIQQSEARNRDTDLDFDNYYPGEFTVGVEGGEVGTIVDLGSPKDLQANYEYKETVGGGQGFASIRREKGEFVIRGKDEKATTQPLAEAKAVLGPGKGSAHVPVQSGHIYLVRLTNRHEPKFERIAKFLVLSYTPGESVTIRWVRLEG